MARIMSASILVLALAVAGCTQPAARSGAGGGDASTAAASRVMAWPACDGLTFPDEPTAPVQCQAQTAGGLLRFTFAAPKAEGEIAVTADLIGPADGVAQTITATQNMRMFAPQLQDLNGDGAPDLLITTDVGNVNSVMTVWMFNAATKLFAEAGEISGVGVKRTDDGLVAVSGRESAVTHYVDFYTVTDLKLVEVGQASFSFDEKDTSKIGRCKAAPPEDNPKAFSLLNLTPAQADAKFCGYVRATSGG